MILETNEKNTLLENFLSYIKIWTTSDSQKADEGIQPSTERQLDLANHIKNQLEALKIKSHITQKGYLCARIKATKCYENCASVGFLAHLDTAGEVSGENVNPKIIENYDGKSITLNDEISILIEENPQLAKCKGQTIITTDGNTLLGADDKAGIAEIMTAIQILQEKNIPHGQIEIIFSPDEETGHGMDNVPLDWLESKQCYTVDGGDLGEIEAECFNAYKSEITFTGKALHTGSARPNMVNAVTMASKFVSMLPQNESPEATDGYLGFYAPMEISGSMESALVTVFLRDFEESGMKRRIETIDSLAQTCKVLFPNGNVETKHTFQYKNMKQVLDKNPHVMQNLIDAVKNVGIEPVIRPIRGGTDGSRLSELGIPTPNIFTGGHNFHSRTEWACLEQMEYSVKTILELIKIYSERKN